MMCVYDGSICMQDDCPIRQQCLEEQEEYAQEE